jgi:adenylate kinase
VVLLLFGPPGCGKGTQSPLLRDWLEIPAISTGDMLRRESSRQTKSGEYIDALLAEGKLVPDALVNSLLHTRLEEADCRSGFLVDGYPRTVQQAANLGALLQRLGHASPVLIHIDVPESKLIARLSARWTCPSCSAVYNLMSKPPVMPGQCDIDGARLFQRRDDTVETAITRLQAYREITDPVLAYYADPTRGRVVHVNGDAAPDEVFAEIHGMLDEQVLCLVRNKRP